jgi:hypothetical protein
MHLRELRSAGHAPSLAAALLHFDVSFMAWVLLGAAWSALHGGPPVTAVARLLPATDDSAPPSGIWTA